MQCDLIYSSEGIFLTIEPAEECIRIVPVTGDVIFNRDELEMFCIKWGIGCEYHKPKPKYPFPLALAASQMLKAFAPLRKPKPRKYIPLSNPNREMPKRGIINNKGRKRSKKRRGY